MELLNEDKLQEMTADEIIEEGVGLIARGLFRLGHRTAGNNPQEALNAGLAAVSTIREIAFDFKRSA